MENVVMQRGFTPHLTEADFEAMARIAAGCLDIYRAEWVESFMALDGSRLVCRFEAPDSESIRQLSRGDGAEAKAVWASTLHDGPVAGSARVVVERSFDEPASMDELQAREEGAADCLSMHSVTFLRSLFSVDRRNMVCLYAAPDAESVRRAQTQAGMPLDRVWACHHYTPDSLAL